jgi:hypothetical protein
MNKKGKWGFWALASLVAGAVAVIWVGPRKINEKITHLRWVKPGERVIEVEGP